VSVEAFSLFLSIQYVAMIIIGGMGSLLGALLGALFVTIFPHLIEAVLLRLPDAQSYAGSLFAVNYAAFGAVMVLVLVFEPLGLVGYWRRIQNYFAPKSAAMGWCRRPQHAKGKHASGRIELPLWYVNDF
jgi:branched-chain amino acid transport system permease protein